MIYKSPQLPSRTSESVYKSFSELSKRVGKLKLSDWDVKNTDTNISLKQFLHPYTVPKLEVIIDSTFNFTIAVYGWIIPENHTIYALYSRSMNNGTVSN